MKYFSILFVTVLVWTNMASASHREFEKFFEERVEMPQGVSEYYKSFPAYDAGSPFIMWMDGEPSCPVFHKIDVFVQHAGSGDWEETYMGNLGYYYSGRPIRAVKFRTVTRAAQSCVVKLYKQTYYPYP